MSEDLDTEDLRIAKERKAETKRRHSLMEQVKSYWSILVSLVLVASAVWSSYDGLRKEVAESTKAVAALTKTVDRLSTSERTVDARVLQLEIRREALIDRLKNLEDWAAAAGRSPQIRRFSAPPPEPKE